MLIANIESLRRENEGLRAKIAELQQAKSQAVFQADERLRAKETLRKKLANQQKSVDDSQRTQEQLAEKITELRAEIERLKKPTRRK